MSIRCLISIGIVLAVIVHSDAQNKSQPPQPQILLDSNAIKQQLLSVDVKDSDIRDVIRMISKGYNLNILLDQGVSGKVTLHLVNVPIMEGLKSIAESNGLALVKDGNVYKIQKATAEEKNLIRYVDGKLTVDVQNVNVKEFLKELSSKTAISIVPESKVDGLISGKLFQVDLDDGLRAILEGNGFKVVRRRNIYQVEASDTGLITPVGRVWEVCLIGFVPVPREPIFSLIIKTDWFLLMSLMVILRILSMQSLIRVKLKSLLTEV